VLDEDLDRGGDGGEGAGVDVVRRVGRPPDPYRVVLDGRPERRGERPVAEGDPRQGFHLVTQGVDHRAPGLYVTLGLQLEGLDQRTVDVAEQRVLGREVVVCGGRTHTGG
jgi:hypothetical protein